MVMTCSHETGDMGQNTYSEMPKAKLSARLPHTMISTRFRLKPFPAWLGDAARGCCQGKGFLHCKVAALPLKHLSPLLRKPYFNLSAVNNKLPEKEHLRVPLSNKATLL